MKDVYYIVAHRDQSEIDSFKTRYQKFDTSLIPAIFQKSLRLTVTNWKQSTSWGTSHVIYFVYVKENSRPLVLRANLGFGEPEVVMLVEKLVTDAVTAIGIPTNHIAYVDVSRKFFPFDFQIEEKLIGEDLENHFSGSQKEYDRLSFELGSLLAKVHTIKYEGFGRFDETAALENKLRGTKSTFYEYITTCLEHDLQQLVIHQIIDLTHVNRIWKLFEERKSIMNTKLGSLVHHDLADHNIMFANNQITGIFDWEASVVGDPVLDLASCPTWRTHYPREQKLIAGYLSISSLPDDFDEKMKIYRLRTMLWKMVFATTAGILNEQRKKKFLEALTPFGFTIP